MSKLIINHDKIKDINELIEICPFGAMEEKDGKLFINSGCKMCKVCVKKGPKGAIEFIEDEAEDSIDKSKWKGVAVYVEHLNGKIHPVTFELIGKARELASKINHPVYAILIGNKTKDMAKELLHYGVDEVFVYDNDKLKDFRIEPYTAAFEDFSNKIKPSIILVGATPIGRSLAPRVAARLKTGLTADCTKLEVKENTDLVQIRPAFGGNVMAQIITPNTRPQLATVRYKVMEAPEKQKEAKGKITFMNIDDSHLKSDISVLKVTNKEQDIDLTEADIIVVAGRGVKKQEDLEMIEELADLLGGQLATTRPLIEAGWSDPRRQIGLSGRTVKPKLIITCGVSGAVQFVAGMSSAENIFAINIDENAPIFDVAHYGIVGDLYEIVPRLIENIKERNKEGYNELQSIGL